MAGRISAQGRGQTSISFHATIAGLEKTSDEFKRARREINAKLRVAVQKAGEKEALPFIRMQFPRKSPNITRGLPSGAMAASLFVKRDRSTVFIGSRLRGQLNRAVGWIDFGGTRGGVLNGRTKERRRRGSFSIFNVLNGRRTQIDRAILRELMEVFDPLDHTP